MKKRVAVLFGGRSPEHDVSIATGLQALKSFDTSRFSPFPVYVTPEGDWLVGPALAESKNYLPKGDILSQLQSVTMDVRPLASGVGRLIPNRAGLFSKQQPVEFDLAFCAFHGHHGENGDVQGLLELANVAYSGTRVMASAIYMNKISTKRLLANSGVATLPSVVLSRPSSGLMLSEEAIVQELGAIRFPVIVKPVNLGSSIGASRATNVSEIRSALPAIFKLDRQVLIEPFVDNLVEYNVSVRRSNGKTLTSAIEQPLRKAALLDFKTKYTGGGGGGGTKVLGSYNPGMLAMTRTLNPSLPADVEAHIRSWATICFDLAEGSGVPRVDFLADSVTGELWFNEVNSCPGSFGFFLWEAAEVPLLFTELLSFLLDEATDLHARSQLPSDPTTAESRLPTITR